VPAQGGFRADDLCRKVQIMTITQTNASSASDLAQLLRTALSSQTSSASSSSSTQTSSTGSASDSTSVSGPGQLFSELEQLSKSNPADFKTVTASISQELKAAANSSSNAQQASFLNQMASNFATYSHRRAEAPGRRLRRRPGRYPERTRKIPAARWKAFSRRPCNR